LCREDRSKDKKSRERPGEDEGGIAEHGFPWRDKVRDVYWALCRLEMRATLAMRIKIRITMKETLKVTLLFETAFMDLILWLAQ
jgi:hypothetical protein